MVKNIVPLEKVWRTELALNSLNDIYICKAYWRNSNGCKLSKDEIKHLNRDYYHNGSFIKERS